MDIDNKDIVISIKGLKKSFGEMVVLDGINVDIFKDENLAILGRSGSGKSVFIKVICGLLKQDSGTVKVFGEEVDTLNAIQLRELRMKIGFSFQSSALYDSMSVRENLEFPLIRNQRNISASDIRKAIEEVLHEVGLSNTINQMPSELSGGQRKRIGIARTLILKPAIMLYDEPTSGLDPLTCIEVNNLILKVQKQYNTTSIIITHDITCAKVTANRVAVLKDGKFLKTGSFTEVFNTEDPILRAFFDYNLMASK